MGTTLIYIQGLYSSHTATNNLIKLTCQVHITDTSETLCKI